jgi:uncharacterized membrane protein HdeD (DUF308 family)
MIGVQRIRKALSDGLRSLEKNRFYRLLIALTVLLFYLLYSAVKGKFQQQAVYFLVTFILISGICWFIDFRAVKSKVNFENDWLNLLFVGIAALSLYLVHCSLFGLPLAQNQDDYSYLLMAKTFAQGRLTKPGTPDAGIFR